MPGYDIDTDLDRIDLDLVHRWLSTDAFWALGRPRDVVQRAAEGSVNFGAYADGVQVGYARLVTDHATFGWLCDVYVAPEHRGSGVGSLLARAVVDHVRPLRLKRVMLFTTDAHDVYARAGFVPAPEPEKIMILADGDQRA